MSLRRCCLLIALAGIIGAYAGFLFLKREDPWAGKTIRITGLMAEGLEDAAEMSSPLRTGAGAAEHAKANLSPTMAVTKCKIRNFRITAASESVEWVDIPVAEISPEELQCLLAVGSTELEGVQNPRAWIAPRSPHYRPLLISLENATKNAQTH